MRNVTWAFWNREERRLRAGWRIVVFVLAVALLALAAQPLFFLAYTPAAERAIEGGASLAVFLFSVFGVGRAIDRRSSRAYGFGGGRRWWMELASGLVLGAALQTAIFLTARGLGWAEVTGMLSAPPGLSFGLGFIIATMIAITSGIGEEVAVRGYLLKNLAEGLNLRIIGPAAAIVAAWLITSALFAVMHVGNPGMSWMAIANLVCAGVLLGLPIVRTGRLAMPIGLHIAWNYFEGGVYGFPVSGGAWPASLISTNLTGPVLWTGGAFGPEAGLLATIAMMLGMAAIWWLTSRSRSECGRPARVFDENVAIHAPAAGVTPIAPSIHA